MIHKTDVAIIGAGPVGLFAVFEAGQLKMKCHVIDTLEFTGGQCTALYPDKPIYDIPAYPKIGAVQLIEKLEEQIAPFKPVYHLGQQVRELKKEQDDTITLVTSKDTVINAKAVLIAAGCGAFGPNRPPLEGIEQFENQSVFYLIRDINKFKDKKVVIAGGGDSAIDWAIILADMAAEVTIVHRRDKFRCAPENLDKLHTLSKQGKVRIATPYQLHSLKGSNGILESVGIVDFNDNIEHIKADFLLPFFGLSMDLGPILDWGLSIERKHIDVEPSTMKTSIPGIYAIGDVIHYTGKLKLILTGFSEAAIACHDIYNIVHPDTPLHFEYSTTKGVAS